MSPEEIVSEIDGRKNNAHRNDIHLIRALAVNQIKLMNPSAVDQLGDIARREEVEPATPRRSIRCMIGWHDWEIDREVRPVPLPPRGVAQLYDRVCVRCGKWNRAASRERARDTAREAQVRGLSSQ